MPIAIPLSDYCAQETFTQEQDHFFRLGWNFAGFKQNLARDKDWITATIAGQSLVIQNFDGELKAFRNVCPHRLSRIRLSDYGNGILQCPYHGWTFNAEGIPAGIPQKSIRLAPGFNAETLRLEAWQVATCGNLVFVRATSAGAPLQDYLGPLFQEISEMTACLGPLLDVNRMIIRANWKVVVENTLDDQHVDFVHPTTFGRLKLRVEEYSHYSQHSKMRATYSGRGRILLEHINRSFRGRPWPADGYQHYLIFPNLTIATSFGVSFSIQTIRPLTADETEFVSYVFLTTGLEEPYTQEILQFSNSIIEFNQQVFEEDRIVCEGVQSGIREMAAQGVLSPDQDRVLDFHKQYKAIMAKLGADSVPIEEIRDANTRNT